MANVGIYQYGSSAVYYVLDASPPNPKGGGNSLVGTTVEQDITPTFLQATEGQAGATETQPTAEVVWRDFSGSMGLYKQSQAPGDLTRCFISDADTTRSGQITAWLRFGSADTVAIDNDGGANPPLYLKGLVNAATAWGVVGSTGVNDCYWSWSGTKFAFQRNIQASPPSSWGTSSRLPSVLHVYARVESAVAPAIVQQTGTNLWSPYVSGSTDISVAAVAGVGVTNAYHTFVYFDILFVVAITGGNITITPYRPNTPGAGNVLNSVTYTGTSACLGTIPGETVCLGVVPCEGAVYICTDKAVYAMQWNDNNNTVLTTKLFELPRITGAPVVWNGEIYIPADNRIAHITPGQRGYDWRVIDSFGVMPAPYNGMIVQLIAFSDSLIAQVTDPYGTGGHCYLRMDANGAWSCLYHQVTNWGGIATNTASGPMVPIVDGTNPQAIAFPNYSSTTSFSTMLACPIPQTNKNPRTLATTARKQRAGPFRTISPYYDLASETAQKIEERIRDQVLSVTNSLPIKVYYQTDFADEAGADTFSSGCAKGTGTWHQCAQIVPSMVAGTHCFAGSTDSSGNGAIWMEFDNATTYTTIGKLPAYPTYKQIRYCYEVNGDTTGTVVPTFLSHAFHRLEFVTKAYERTLHIRIRVGEDQGTGQQPSSTVTYSTNAAIVTAKNALRTLVSNKTVCTFVDETNTSNVVVPTKYRCDLMGVDANGQPNEYRVELTVQLIQLVGQN